MIETFWLQFESITIFLHDTSVDDDASPYQGWLHKVQQFGMHDPDKNILEIWNVCSDLDFIPSDQFISQDTPARGDVPSVEEGREIR